MEALGTAILMFVILAVTDERNAARPPPQMAPFFIGFTVAILISVFAPLTQAGWNPARDFGPRLVAAVAGWGHTALPGPRAGFWAYIVGPLLGAPTGAGCYDVLVAPGLATVTSDSRCLPRHPADKHRDTHEGASPGPTQRPCDAAALEEGAGIITPAAGPAIGMWCADQAVLHRIVREACAQACIPGCAPPDSPGRCTSIALDSSDIPARGGDHGCLPEKKDEAAPPAEVALVAASTSALM